MIELLRKHVPAATIEIPEGSGGMFLWVRLKVESHPDFTSAESSKTPEEISAQVFQRMISNKVLMCPSIYFKAPSTQKWTREQEAKRIFVRISYSLPPPEEMEEGTRRMAAALKAEWGL
jgi:aromatic amino acid aminotransferase I